MSNFNQFVAGIEQSGLKADTSKLSAKDKATLGLVYGSVKHFLNDNHLVSSNELGGLEQFSSPIKSFNKAVALADLGYEKLNDLVTTCEIPEKYRSQAIESVALCIENYKTGYNAGEHFKGGGLTDGLNITGLEMKSFSANMSKGMASQFMDPKSALESFGQFMDNTIVDAKVAIAITLLRYHRSGLHRIVPVVPTDSNVIIFKVENLEVYDLVRSQNASAATRYDDNHRTAFVDLYRDPTPANNAAKPILLRTANDPAAPDDKLFAANVAKNGVTVNMFDYTIDANTVGYQNIDYTDLVSDGAKLKAVYVQMVSTIGPTTEVVAIPVSSNAGSRFAMSANAGDSADRLCNMEVSAILDNATLQSSGVASAILTGMSDDGIIRLDLSSLGKINLKTSNVQVNTTLDKQEMLTRSGNAVVGGDTTIYDAITMSIVGYEIDAKFSEENVRKTTKAMRIVSRALGYEIPGTASIIVQYSQNDARPETVIDSLAKLLALGNDDRGVRQFLDTIAEVKDRLTAEANLTGINYTKRVMNEYAAGHQSKPAIYIDSINISTDVANMRSAEMWGDVRGMVEKALMEILIRLMQESFYMQALPAGEKPAFKVLTSQYVLGGLLSVPHYHNLLADTAADNKSDDGIIEFRRTLPNGMILDVVTTTFDYMADKMLIIPNRQSDPRSVLNFAQNIERGTYATQSTPAHGSIFNQVVANSREGCIVTNPVAAIFQIVGVSNIFDGVKTLGI